MLTEISSYLEEHGPRFEQELCQLLKIPSVSTDQSHAADVRRAAQWMAEQFMRLGLKTQILETAGHPLVYAETPAVENAPAALVYGHYDVQPAEPLEPWATPPFEPSIREGNVYARGATDDKGQMFTHVKSLEAWLKSAGRLPIQLKFLIEGEEEIGSPHLVRYLDSAAHREQLACDIVVISDTSKFSAETPAITYGLRGIAYYELKLTGPRNDLHSGTFGGAVVNPALALCRMLAALVDDRGCVRVPGFYDDVQPMEERERESFSQLRFDEARFREQLGVSALGGEAGFSTLERRWARPSCDINGLTSGYQGPGAKTVLPAQASAKFSFRLVPHQEPEKITKALDAYLHSVCPAGVSMELLPHSGAPGVVVPLDSPYIAAAAKAIEQGFGVAPVFIREGGSIPIVNAFREALGVDSLLLGWGRDDDHPHGPNEKFNLDDFHRGIRASAHLWDELAKVGRG